MEKGFPLVSEGDGAVVRALHTEHCFVTCDVVLVFFAVPKTTVRDSNDLFDITLMVMIETE